MLGVLVMMFSKTEPPSAICHMQIMYYCWPVVIQVINFSTQEAETGMFLCVSCQPALQGEIQDSQGYYTENPFQEKWNK